MQSAHVCVCVCSSVCLSVYVDLVHGFLMELEQLVLNRSSCVCVTAISSRTLKSLFNLVCVKTGVCAIPSVCKPFIMLFCICDE